MRLRKGTIEKFADVLIRLGEATLIGSVATFFVEGFSRAVSTVGALGGIGLLLVGLYVHNLAE